MVTTRLIPFPRELVWSAFTDPEHLKLWWGPNGFTNTFFQFDMSPGGVWKFMMHGPDGVDYPNQIIFEEVVAPERLVYTHSGGEEAPDDHEFHSTITLEEQDGKTRVTMRMEFLTAKAKEIAATFGAIEGGKQTLGRLEAHVATMV